MSMGSTSEINKGTEIVVARPPEDLTTEQRQRLDEQAKKDVTALIKAKGDIFADETNAVLNVGLTEQNKIASNVQSMEEQMGNIFYNREKDDLTSNISKDITRMHDIAARVNPSDIRKQTKYKLIAMVPFFGNKIISILKESSIKAMTMKEYVKEIADSLSTSEKMVIQDSGQLKVINDQLKPKQFIIQSNIYLAEKEAEELQTAINSGQHGEAIKANLIEALAQVRSRITNLRENENIIQQFFVTIKETRKQHDYLLAGVREVKTNGMMVFGIAMVIHSMLVRQGIVAGIIVGSGETTGRMLVSNAEDLNTMIDKIGEIRKNPWIPLQMEEEANLKLAESIDKVLKLNMEVIESGKENASKIKIWTEDLRTKSGQVIDTSIKSIGAGEVLQLEQGKEEK